ncbi:hypothetical protein EDB82DRAFT_479148 [Fusarium venenatum]|uniref:uncharacterized protein n=1 Tax=Fusarium venenatum TaxID=56646 RepID=UPI001E122B27|nr:hypothetical protein EDB82DRAFT_479148 [Fusarium venenatum]
MNIGDVVKIGNVATPIESEPTADVKDIVGDFISVKPDLIKIFFSTFDKDNKRQVPDEPDIKLLPRQILRPGWRENRGLVSRPFYANQSHRERSIRSMLQLRSRLSDSGQATFVSSLARLRSIIRQRAMKDSKIKVVTKTGPSDNSYRSKKNVLKSLQDTIERLQQIQNPTPPDSDGDGDVGNEFRPGGAIKQAFNVFYMGKDKNMYNETNDPVSTDWIVDCMFLDRVPAHYLISDPSHIPLEALRYFYIDRNWLDAMVDGALSLANHMGQDMDRAAIKWGINQFLKHTPEQQTHRPQVPTYGFYLRSDLVTMYPDLRVTTKGDDTCHAPLLRHEILTDGVMLGLLD